MVSRIPSIRSFGLICRFMRRTVPSSCSRPFADKYCGVPDRRVYGHVTAVIFPFAFYVDPCILRQIDAARFRTGLDHRSNQNISAKQIFIAFLIGLRLIVIEEERTNDAYAFFGIVSHSVFQIRL